MPADPSSQSGANNPKHSGRFVLAMALVTLDDIGHLGRFPREFLDLLVGAPQARKISGVNASQLGARASLAETLQHFTRSLCLGRRASVRDRHSAQLANA
jgi:hypothetical protein